MPQFTIPVVYQMYGTYTVEADTLAEAIDKALDLPDLPNDGSYISDSLQVDEHPVIRDLNPGLVDEEPENENGPGFDYDPRC